MRFAIAIIAWLIAAPAWAFLPGQPVGMLNPQVQPANASAGLPAVDDNLAAGGYPIAGGICAEWGHQVPCNNHYSTTRASTKYVSASDGRYVSVPANVMAMGSGNGSLIEEARTNLALTQGGTWIAVTMTAALNAVGIDGAANSASTLTSTSAAGTILQSLTQASAAYTYTVYVKGVTVTGAIQVADYPVLTPAFTTLSASNCTNAAGVGTAPATGQTGFLKCSVTATSLNPVIGFKFANSGDSIVADFNQLEAGTFGTSPCLTTSATCARSADNTSASGALLSALQNSQGTEFAQANIEGVTAGTNVSLIRAGPNNTFGMQSNNLSGVNGGSFLNGIANLCVASGGFAVGVSQKMIGSWKQSNYALSLNGAAVVTSANAGTLTPNQTPYFIGGNSSTWFLNGSMMRVVIWNAQLPNATLPSM